VVFIVTLAVAGALLGGFTGQPALPMFLAFLIALVLTAAVVLAICKITQRPVDRGDSSKL
jgi:anaerobic C4-dicarboxylate transporter